MEIKAVTQTVAVFSLLGEKRTNSSLSLTLLSKTEGPLIFWGTEPAHAGAVRMLQKQGFVENSTNAVFM